MSLIIVLQTGTKFSHFYIKKSYYHHYHYLNLSGEHIFWINYKQSQISELLQKPLEYVTGIRCLHSNRKTRQNKTLQLIVSKYKKLGTKPAIEWALIICHLVLQMFPMREDSKKHSTWNAGKQRQGAELCYCIHLDIFVLNCQKHQV